MSRQITYSKNCLNIQLIGKFFSIAKSQKAERLDVLADFENSETLVHKLESITRYVRHNYGQRDSLGRVDHLSPYPPSKTVTAVRISGGGWTHFFPVIPMTLRVRVCTRLQSFPDEYTFSGLAVQQFSQVGYVFPPNFATRIGESLANSVFGV